MTNRSNRPQGRGQQRSAPEPGKGGARKPASGKPSKARPGRHKPEERAEGAPHSKRYGKRPPKAVREGGSAERRPPEGNRSSGAPRYAAGGDRGSRAPSTEGGERRSPYKKPWADKSGPKRGFGGYRGKPRPEPRGEDDGRIRLNRYLSMSGVASRRDADDLIRAGVVSVNGVVVTEMGAKVGPGDKVVYGGQRLSRETKRYVLLNKPKDFITTTDDPRDRRTVMALVEHACDERIYPVGRLDRHTTGLLLLTNDGDLAKKLTHPSHGAEKIYHVTLDKNVTLAHLQQLVKGVPLDDGPAAADEASYVDGVSKREVGLKLHMGRNRIVRRMFEALGYEVLKLDRVVFAGLTKKNLPRSKWRHLTEKEVLFLTRRK